MNSIRLLVVSLLIGAMSLTSAVRAQAPTDESQLYNAWSYLLGRALIIRQENTDMREPGMNYNVIKYYNSPSSTAFVNPNFDVNYLESWIAIDDSSAVLLSVPEIKDRYYTIQLLNEWGDNITNINNRVYPNHPSGVFALITAHSNVKLPEGVVPVILPTHKAKLMGRIELKDTPEEATKLLQAVTLSVTGTPRIELPPAIPDFTNGKLPGVALFDNAEAILQSAPDYTPVAAGLQQSVRDIAQQVHASSQYRQQTDNILTQRVIPAFMQEAHTGIATLKNNWLGGHREGRGYNGHYGTDYRMRTSLNLLGIWANSPGEAVYYLASKDSNGQSLNGNGFYRLHFPANALPETMAKAFWSIIMVSIPDYQVIPNPLKRYNFNNYSGLKKNSDGSLDIVIGPRPPKHFPESNWLPSAPDHAFAFTFRAYVPEADVAAGDRFPPVVTPVNENQF
ncbi:DUF1214 domain-containing protein [Trabulsiella odontotermitis]|uniref:DUF1214 domain-containing protein n=1 Tax=Trabulsiella odontotermitis TaxID=379893 RepID=UPI0024B6C211|nr:DUF1214 domain-containing protein [Trabulsiella odontotermitis]WHP33213.1 DUF1214 domain-containing protein [Trabulsiella odontotermitis]